MVKKNYVCKLDKALYGLKQVPPAWYAWLCGKLEALGFVPSKADTSLFYYRRGKLVMFVLVYVDVIVASSSHEATGALLKDLEQEFALKDFGDLHYFLGIEVQRSRDGLKLSQGRYAADILQRASISKCKSINTPMSNTKRISATEGDKLRLEDSTKYRSIVWALQYITLTHRDIPFSVNKVCQFLQESTTFHWGSVKRILRYVQGSLRLGLKLGDLSL
jgi:histone deacetylase 1/2